MPQTRIRIGKQTIVSTSPYSTVITDATNEQEYVPQGLAGEVLTSNGVGVAPSYQAPGGGSGFTSGFAGTKLADKAIPLNTWTIIDGWTENYDGLGEFDPITGLFTVTTAGRYLMTAQCAIDVSLNTTGVALIGFAINGNMFTACSRPGAGVPALTAYIEHTIIKQLAIGDIIALRANINGGTGSAVTLRATTVTAPGTLSTFFEIQRIF